jgi:serine/threonine protein kinase
MINNDGRPIIIDFGESKIISGNTMTKDKGTENYIAPEVRGQNNQKNKYDYKADIYSLGIVFAQVLFHLNTSDFGNFIAGQDFNEMKH